MTSILARNKAFVHLLLSTNNTQQKSLINSITSPQVDTITEILYNLLHVVPLTSEEEKIVKQRRRKLEKLALISRSLKFRKSLILKHKIQLLKLLLHFKDKLLEVAK